MAKKHKKEASFGAFFWCAVFWGGARLKMMVSGPFHECSGWRRTPFGLVCGQRKKGCNLIAALRILVAKDYAILLTASANREILREEVFLW